MESRLKVKKAKPDLVTSHGQFASQRGQHHVSSTSALRPADGNFVPLLQKGGLEEE